MKMYMKESERERIQITEIEKGLVKKASETMHVLGIPEELGSDTQYFPKEGIFNFLTGISQEEIFEVDIEPMLLKGPAAEIGHSIRVAIIGNEISRILGFEQDSRVANFLMGLIHDEGKLKNRRYYPENNHYKKGSKIYCQYLTYFKHGHVDLKNLPRQWEDMLASAVEQHHTHQKEAYPEKLSLPRTAESYFLSKLLAIPDYLDSRASRLSIETGKYNTPSEVPSLCLEEYGNMRINYSGPAFPSIDINGKEIIQELQKTRFIGREKPENISEEDFRMNPFKGLEIK